MNTFHSDIRRGGRKSGRRCFQAIALLLILPAAVMFAQNANLGTAGAQFLKIPVGGRATGLGGAFVSNANDVEAAFWNPAGITGVKSGGVMFSHSAWWSTVQLNHAAYVQSLEDIGSFGVSMTVLSMDAMEVTTELEPEGTGQTFDAGDMMFGLTYARKLTEEFSVGVTAKIVQQRIWNEKATGVAFDIGTQYRIGYRDLTLGMSMMNFGGNMQYDGIDLSVDYPVNQQNSTVRLAPAHLTPDEYPLPLHFQVGISMSPYVSDELSVLLAADVAHPNDNQENLNFGMEVTIFKQFFIRGGYRMGYDTDRATLGAGVAAPLGDINLTFDYAYSIYYLLPNINRISFGLTF